MRVGTRLIAPVSFVTRMTPEGRILTVRQRVARYLISLSETPLATENGDGYMVVSATHELIAEGTASTRESVSKIITELRSEGLIESGYRSIVLLQPEQLDEISQGF